MTEELNSENAADYQVVPNNDDAHAVILYTPLTLPHYAPQEVSHFATPNLQKLLLESLYVFSCVFSRDWVLNVSNFNVNDHALIPYYPPTLPHFPAQALDGEFICNLLYNLPISATVQTFSVKSFRGLDFGFTGPLAFQDELHEIEKEFKYIKFDSPEWIQDSSPTEILSNEKVKAFQDVLGRSCDDTVLAHEKHKFLTGRNKTERAMARQAILDRLEKLKQEPESKISQPVSPGFNRSSFFHANRVFNLQKFDYFGNTARPCPGYPKLNTNKSHTSFAEKIDSFEFEKPKWSPLR